MTALLDAAMQPTLTRLARVALRSPRRAKPVSFPGLEGREILDAQALHELLKFCGICFGREGNPVLDVDGLHSMACRARSCRLAESVALNSEGR